MKCENCGRIIKNPYYFDKHVYGIECWKIIALPEIEKRRNEKYASIQKEKYLEASVCIQVLKLKDWSKIVSNFKINFSNSVEEQYNTKGFLSNKQMESISAYLFNGKDWKNYWRLAVESGLHDKQNLIDTGLMDAKDF